jgi:cytochrome c-type biogenesis protein CcmH
MTQRRVVVRTWILAWLLVAGLLLVAGAAYAQGGTPPPSTQRVVTADDVNRIAKQMYCPVCENEPLDACRTSACQQWRAQIAQMLSDGQSEDQIKQYFVDHYGLRVLGAPPAEGITLWLWVLPVVGLVAGGAYVVVLMRRMRARAANAVAQTPVAAPPDADSSDYARRIESDLKKW